MGDVSKTRRSKHNTPSSGESLEWDSYHHQTDEADISDDDVGSIDLHEEFLAAAENGVTSTPAQVRRQSLEADRSSSSASVMKRSSPISMTQLHSDTSPFVKRRRSNGETSSAAERQMRDDVTNVTTWCDRITTSFDDVVNYRGVTVAQLEQYVKDLQDLQREFESRRPLVLSINLMNAPGDAEVVAMNRKWRNAESLLAMKRQKLQQILVESQEFKETVDDLDCYVTDTEQARDRLDTNDDDKSVTSLRLLRRRRKSLEQLRSETTEKIVQLSALHDINDVVKRNVVNDVTARLRSRTSSNHGSRDDRTSRRLDDVTARLRTLLGDVSEELTQTELSLQHVRRDSSVTSDGGDSVESTETTSLHASSTLKLKKMRRKLRRNKH